MSAMLTQLSFACSSPKASMISTFPWFYFCSLWQGSKLLHFKKRYLQHNRNQTCMSEVSENNSYKLQEACYCFIKQYQGPSFNHCTKNDFLGDMNKRKVVGFNESFKFKDVAAIMRIVLLRSESPNGKCAKLHTVAASNNRHHAPQSLYYCLFVPHIYGCCSSRTSRSCWISRSTQQQRGCSSRLHMKLKQE